MIKIKVHDKAALFWASALDDKGSFHPPWKFISQLSFLSIKSLARDTDWANLFHSEMAQRKSR